MSEGDAYFDAMMDRIAREEQDNIDRTQGQFILDAMDTKNNPQGVHPLIEAINRAYQAEAEVEAEADKQ